MIKRDISKSILAILLVVIIPMMSTGSAVKACDETYDSTHAKEKMEEIKNAVMPDDCKCQLRRGEPAETDLNEIAKPEISDILEPVSEVSNEIETVETTDTTDTANPVNEVSNETEKAETSDTPNSINEESSESVSTDTVENTEKENESTSHNEYLKETIDEMKVIENIAACATLVAAGVVSTPVATIAATVCVISSLIGIGVSTVLDNNLSTNEMVKKFGCCVGELAAGYALGTLVIAPIAVRVGHFVSAFKHSNTNVGFFKGLERRFVNYYYEIDEANIIFDAGVEKMEGSITQQTVLQPRFFYPKYEVQNECVYNVSNNTRVEVGSLKEIYPQVFCELTEERNLSRYSCSSTSSVDELKVHFLENCK